MSEQYDDLKVLHQLLEDEKAAPADPHTIHALETAIRLLTGLRSLEGLVSRQPKHVGYGYDKHGNIVPIVHPTTFDLAPKPAGGDACPHCGGPMKTSCINCGDGQVQ